MSLFVSKLIFGFSRLVLQPQATGPSRAFGLSAALANVRNHFPRPNEKKRIVRHGWLARLATKGGRAILMRRILKGRHVLSH